MLVGQVDDRPPRIDAPLDTLRRRRANVISIVWSVARRKVLNLPVEGRTPQDVLVTAGKLDPLVISVVVPALKTPQDPVPTTKLAMGITETSLTISSPDTLGSCQGKACENRPSDSVRSHCGLDATFPFFNREVAYGRGNSEYPL